MSKKVLLYWDVINGDGRVTEVRGIEFDAVVAYEASRASQATQYPVEGSTTYSDHVQPGQFAFSMEAFVTDTPIKPTLGDVRNRKAGGTVTAVAPLPAGSTRDTQLDLSRVYTSPTHAEFIVIPSPRVQPGLPSQRLVRSGIDMARSHIPKKAQVLTFDTPVTRVKDVYNELDDLQLRRTPVTVSAPGLTDDLPYMFITSLRAPRTAADGESAMFYINLVQLDVVLTANRSVSTTMKPKNPGHKPKQSAGKTPVGSVVEPRDEFDSTRGRGNAVELTDQELRDNLTLEWIDYILSGSGG